MILVLDLEVRSEYRYLGPEIDRLLPTETEYYVFVENPTVPKVGTYDGVVLSGSTASVYDDTHETWVEPASEIVRRCRELDVPLLGICFGHQLVHQTFGGTVERDQRRATFVDLEIFDRDDPLLADLQPTVPVLHADIVVEPGDGLRTTAQTSYNTHFCSRHVEAPIWTVQFHPEFTERVEDEPDDWDPGQRSFESSNGTRVLDAFADIALE